MVQCFDPYLIFERNASFVYMRIDSDTAENSSRMQINLIGKFREGIRFCVYTPTNGKVKSEHSYFFLTENVKKHEF